MSSNHSRKIFPRSRNDDAGARTASSNDVCESGYDREAEVAARVAGGAHRGAVGGLWEEVGELQFQFLRTQGLRPNHRLLDVGCGALRGGVKFIPYLKPGNYWGIDNNAALIEAGWDLELGQANLRDRQPKEQLLCLKDFEFDLLNERFDYAIALSVFTHLGFNRIRRCLTRLSPVMESGGRFFATIFEVDHDADREEPNLNHPGGVITHSSRDPYHYRLEDLQYAASGLPFKVHYHGEWGHPRDQRMLEFEMMA